ncbi:3D-(3,5/4)-trihydroxycyclohexane-1,2-dione acylhydrolase (decyclizing) [Virgibacillus pantothenticus]|uniref:3D-(3,5/4)-trihydroxycyclohexane-1,2-dione acylhydrolase (decyclizing) n=1 Tax=Virgibacillus pantothenticus TaxID=1473 RepID=UPI001C21E80E|nr:3D-(3,5/4)-trihydroxycyclohexane-1,2-dione acylhydrolase (decyclizing) [Virgibacillus pantothenticus]MBU8568532.1 3D-(3,5/4)-trihydroxycyclohexane-1,2-dione acylhydrolase (decyclizing) [Virgibacillus pantothenticus]MBU8602497.1 3D-(3,5/4)-trihydroxycyclohexane-1,2-dione acylhydrolase (decyclizing) [Virgibacillus pantothenticus]MBU8636680.1 3D-(3,5/4)-trihydroxycyclohexane-1,2-dione acylhydrolase (decyclizing) [Virgibacillus pantothenticus]MBU8644342.1 3D-(3,5/4)-trihydroxycyclohexane-1,2-dio
MVETIRLTTAQALIKFLNQQYLHVDGEESPYVEGIFHIYGHGNVVGIGQALEEDPGHLKTFIGKNEQGMAHAAVAFSKQSLRKKIYALSTSAGPGAANMIAAAGTALANNIPVLLLPADTFATRQPDPVLQQIEQDTSMAVTTNDAFKAVSRYWDRIQRPEQLMTALIRAFEVMTNPATAGPATICLSQDVEGEAFDYPVEFFKKRVHYFNRTVPTKREIEGAVERIKNSSYPVIIVGGGCKYSKARQELIAISEKHHIPLVETHAGKSTVEWQFKNNLGGLGILGTSAANKAVKKADLIIGIGTRYTDFTTSSKTLFNFEKTKFLNINVSRPQSYKLDAFQVVSDAKATLQELLPLLEGYTTAFNDTLEELKSEWLKERDRLANVRFKREGFVPEIKGHFSQETLNEYADALDTELTQTEVFIALNEAVDEDAIVVSAAGSLPGDMQRLWNPSVPNTYHLEYGYSCMGYEIAGALGARLAAPHQEVYSLVGDGSFLMLHTELVTALQYNKKINIVLFDNSGFGCINNLQMDNGSASQGTEFRTWENQIMNVDYAKVAEGYGAKTYKIKTLDELKRAIEDAKKQPNSTLFEIKVLPKTMTDGYEGSWWNVGLSEVSTKESIRNAFANKQKEMKRARKY